MIRIERSVQIDRPRGEVFAFLTDIESLPQWQTGVVHSGRLTEGDVRPGFRFEETVKVALWKLYTVCSVTDVKGNERFAFEARSSGPIDYDGAFELQPVAGGTRLTLEGSVRLKGLWRLLQPLLAGDLRKETRQELDTMKRLLEARTSVSGQASTGGV